LLDLLTQENDTQSYAASEQTTSPSDPVVINENVSQSDDRQGNSPSSYRSSITLQADGFLYNEPQSYIEAMASKDADKWKKAMDKRMDSLLHKSRAFETIPMQIILNYLVADTRVTRVSLPRYWHSFHSNELSIIRFGL